MMKISTFGALRRSIPSSHLPPRAHSLTRFDSTLTQQANAL